MLFSSHHGLEQNVGTPFGHMWRNIREILVNFHTHMKNGVITLVSAEIKNLSDSVSSGGNENPCCPSRIMYFSLDILFIFFFDPDFLV